VAIDPEENRIAGVGRKDGDIYFRAKKSSRLYFETFHRSSFSYH
jgi:hypothetical protein